MAEVAALGGLRKPPQLQPVPVATRPVGAGIPSLVHSMRCTLHRPVPSRLGGADLSHVPRPHMAAESSWRRSRSLLKAGHISRMVSLTWSWYLPVPRTAQKEQSFPAARHTEWKGQGIPGTRLQLCLFFTADREGLEGTGVAMGRAAQERGQS